MGFTVIETQEQFDKAIGDRLTREKETVEKRYEGYLSPEDVTKKYEGYLSPEDVKKKYEGYLSPEDVAEKDKKLKAYETNSVKMRVARENGLSYDAVEFIKGEDEESIKKSASALKTLLGVKKGAPPLATGELCGAGDKKDAEFRNMLRQMKGE